MDDVILKRYDQERVFTTETIRRMQKQLDDQQQEINNQASPAGDLTRVLRLYFR